jgi:hypothetical protein
MINVRMIPGDPPPGEALVDEAGLYSMIFHADEHGSDKSLDERLAIAAQITVGMRIACGDRDKAKMLKEGIEAARVAVKEHFEDEHERESIMSKLQRLIEVEIRNRLRPKP